MPLGQLSEVARLDPTADIPEDAWNWGFVLALGLSVAFSILVWGAFITGLIELT